MFSLLPNWCQIHFFKNQIASENVEGSVHELLFYFILQPWSQTVFIWKRGASNFYSVHVEYTHGLLL